jgi:hypothetical protein
MLPNKDTIGVTPDRKKDSALGEEKESQKDVSEQEESKIIKQTKKEWSLMFLVRRTLFLQRSSSSLMLMDHSQ